MSVTVLDNDVDTSSIEALDFDHETPCTAWYGCDHVAKWRAVISCCKRVALYCDKDMKQTLESVRLAGGASDEMYCGAQWCFVESHTPLKDLA